MQTRTVLTRSALVVAIGAACAAPAWAMTMPDLSVPTHSDIVQVNDHHHHHDCHRRGHQAHGYDDTYSNDDANGTLFKSFVMGELTGDRKPEPRREEN